MFFYRPSVREWVSVQKIAQKCYEEKIELQVKINHKSFNMTRPTLQACQCFLLKTWFGKQREGEEEGGWTSSARESSLGSTGGSGGTIYGRT